MPRSQKSIYFVIFYISFTIVIYANMQYFVRKKKLPAVRAPPAVGSPWSFKKKPPPKIEPCDIEEEGG